jgi:hypothetical protein
MSTPKERRRLDEFLRAHAAELDLPLAVALMSALESETGRRIDYPMLEGALRLRRSRRSVRFVDPANMMRLILTLATPPERPCQDDELAERYLEEVNALMGFTGVVSLDTSDGRVAALYVNTGETYDLTVLYDVANGSFTVISWGDWMEWAENTRRPRLHFR